MKDKSKKPAVDKIKKTQSSGQMVCHTCSSYIPENSKDLWKPANLGKQRHKPVVNRTGKSKPS